MQASWSCTQARLLARAVGIHMNELATSGMLGIRVARTCAWLKHSHKLSVIHRALAHTHEHNLLAGTIEVQVRSHAPTATSVGSHVTEGSAPARNKRD